MDNLASQWQQITELEINPDDVAYLINEMARRRDKAEDDDFFTSIAILGERFHGQEKSADRMFCISTRMECLLGLTKDERMRGWTTEMNVPQHMLANWPLFHAVAACPLRVHDDRFYFDADEFFSIALEEIEPEGHA
jgi:hypothetical protein